MRGQSLIEVVVALGMAITVVVSITALIVSALDSANFRKNQNLANAYAQEGMEVVRKIRDNSSWSTFTSLPGGPNFCLPQNGTELVSRSGSPNCDGKGNVGIFLREITIRNNNPDCTAGGGNSKVTVKVSWSDGKCSTGNSFCHKAEIISCFADNQTVVAP